MLGFVLAILLGVVHSFSYRINIKNEKLLSRSKSLLAGATVTYLFVIALPEVLQDGDLVTRMILVAQGFVLIHFIQGSLVKTLNHKEMSLLSARMYEFIYFIYNIVSSFLIAEIADKQPLYAMVIFLAVSLHSILSDMVIKEFEGRAHLEERFVHIILALAPLIGYVLAIAGNQLFDYAQILFSLSIGIMFYVAIREEIPIKKDAMNPIIFIAGSVFIITLVILS